MENLHDVGFTLYVRLDKPHDGRREIVERPLITCSSYSEAREIQRQYLRAHQQVVIRFDGITGGGD